MAAELTINETTSVPKGTVIFEKDDELNCVALVLKGRVMVRSTGVCVSLGSGNFLGICDVSRGVHSFTYVAGDGVSLYPIPIRAIPEAKKLIEGKPQYRGLLVTSQNFFLRDINRSYTKLLKSSKDLKEYIKESYNTYKNEAAEAGFVATSIPAIERLYSEVEDKIQLSANLTYYMDVSGIDVEAQRSFFGAKSSVAFRHYIEQCELFPGLIEGCRIYGEQIFKLFRILILDEKNLFNLVAKTVLDMKNAGQDGRVLSELVDDIIGKIDECEKLLVETVGMDPKLNREPMEKTYMALLSEGASSEDIEADEKDIASLGSSLTQIIGYSEVDEETAQVFTKGISDFMKMSDRYSRTKEAGQIRKKITEGFFTIYEAAVKKSFSDPKPPLAVKLFLTYGYVSEELLTAEDLKTLVSLPDIGAGDLDCHVYTMREWLKAIYDGQKLPSKDEFDEDYEEHIRKDAPKGDKTSVKRELEDGDAKLHFEIDKLFKYADRLVNGNISTFVPILCSEAILTTLSSSAVTGAAINAAVRKIEKIDYSIFYREVRASYEDAGINNFTNIERYTPDFIIFPVSGGGAQMWQDIEGKTKASHARILMPAICEGNLDETILKMMAHFRWEKCRTDMGAQWNNYRYPSLTSEYTDYLQFYKKNSDLSAEKKEKVKSQLTQAGNRHRDVFTKDYSDWILREAVGAMRLNKITRDILFTYCPISGEIAAGLVAQTPYADAAKRHNTEFKKTEKNISNIIHKFEKNGIDLPEEIIQTKKYLLEA